MRCRYRANETELDCLVFPRHFSTGPEKYKGEPRKFFSGDNVCHGVHCGWPTPWPPVLPKIGNEFGKFDLFFQKVFIRFWSSFLIWERAQPPQPVKFVGKDRQEFEKTGLVLCSKCQPRMCQWIDVLVAQSCNVSFHCRWICSCVQFECCWTSAV